MKSLLLLLCAASGLFAFDGTVHNATTGKAQGNVTVSLFQITKNGPQMLASGKATPAGVFQLSPPAGSESPGPKLLQAVYQGVTYNRMITPRDPTEGLQIDVYDATSSPAAARVTTHMMLLEPQDGQLTVSESFVYENNGNVTYNDPNRGTLEFYLPPATGGKVDLRVLAPNSVPVSRAADPTKRADVYKVDFPIKPGNSRIDLTYRMPFTSPGVLTTKALFRNPNTKLLAPAGVTLSGTGLNNIGQEPRTKSAIYNFDGKDLEVSVNGSGSLPRAESSAADDSDTNSSEGAEIASLLPQLYDKTSPAEGPWASLVAVKWLLLLVFSMLALAFAYLYRKPGRL